MTVLEQCYSLLEVLGFSLFDRQLVHEVGVGMGFKGVGVIGQSLLEFGVRVRFEGVRVIGQSLLEVGDFRLFSLELAVDLLNGGNGHRPYSIFFYEHEIIDFLSIYV